MWKISSLLVLGALLSACDATTRSGQTLEDFGEFFSKAQQDAQFRSERTSTGLKITEIITWFEGAKTEIRAIPCGPAEIEANGWQLLPNLERLQETGTRYSRPVHLDKERILVSLGAQDREPDAEYTFEARGGAWYLTQLVVFTTLDTDDSMPPLPCDK